MLIGSQSSRPAFGEFFGFGEPVQQRRARREACREIQPDLGDGAPPGGNPSAVEYVRDAEGGRENYEHADDACRDMVADVGMVGST
jgi:hypothetical protein